MDYLCSKFGDCSFSRFGQADTQTLADPEVMARGGELKGQ